MGISSIGAACAFDSLPSTQDDVFPRELASKDAPILSAADVIDRHPRAAASPAALEVLAKRHVTTGPVQHAMTLSADVAEETGEPGEATEAVAESRSITSPRYEANDVQAIRNALGYEKTTALSPITDQQNKLPHMFRRASGHVPDTPVNRAIIQETARVGRIVHSGTDRAGGKFEVRARILPSGFESWVNARSTAGGRMMIEDGGIGPRKYLSNQENDGETP